MSENNKNSSVIDLPRKVVNNKPEEDLFGIETYQNALVEFVNDSQTPLTIALQGEWGSGKTSLMNLLEHKLCNNEGKFYRVWINSWQYSLMKTPEEAIMRIIEGMIEQILKTLSDAKVKNETVEKMKTLFKKITLAGGKFVAKQLVDKAGGNADYVEGLFGGSGSEGAEISQMKNEIESLIKEIIEKGIDKNKKGFLFFIDDLDRIDPPIAVQILELLKNIFDLDKCIFILAIDYDVVIKGLEPKFGKLTEKNEREFRSFFDKIIQMPFSMPVAGYSIDKYLINALKKIDYINENETIDSEFAKNLTEFASLSVGQNPRSLKRLTNTLSLINIINKKNHSEKPETETEKLIGFAMVCLQIAYPLVYNKLIDEPYFTEWNEEIAVKLKLAPLTEELERLKETEEFNDEWEKILFRMCQKDTYSSNRVFQISSLLNKVKDLIPDDLGDVLREILKKSAITNLQANDKPPILNRNRAEIQNNLKDFIKTNLPSKLKQPLIQKINILSKSDNGNFEIRTGVSNKQLTDWMLHGIFVLVTVKDSITSFSIRLNCVRTPDNMDKFIVEHQDDYQKCKAELTQLSQKFYPNSFKIEENLGAGIHNRYIYQIKSIIEYKEEFNTESNFKLITDFISEWACITLDFSKKIGW